MCTHTLSQVLRPRRNLLLKGFWLGVCSVEPVTSRLPWAGLWAGAARWNLGSSRVSNWELPIPFLFQVRGASVSCCSGGSLSCPGPCGLGHHLCVLRREEKRKASLLLLLPCSCPAGVHPLLQHTSGGTGTIQANVCFAFRGLFLILVRDCKGGKNRTEHASSSSARLRSTASVGPWHTAFTASPQSSYKSASGMPWHMDFAEFLSILKFTCHQSVTYKLQFLK